MCTSFALRLGGFVRTIPDLSTFVHPVFLDHTRSPVLQQIENDRITGWRRYRPDETLELVNSNLIAKPGDPSVYGFVFTDESLMFGERARLAQSLATDSRINALKYRQPRTFVRIRRFIDESSPHFFSIKASDHLEHTTALSSNPVLPMLRNLLQGIGKHSDRFIGFHAPLPPAAHAASGLQGVTLRVDESGELELQWGRGILTVIPLRTRPTPLHLTAISAAGGHLDSEVILSLDIVEHQVMTPFEPNGPFLFVLNRT